VLFRPAYTTFVSVASPLEGGEGSLEARAIGPLGEVLATRRVEPESGSNHEPLEDGEDLATRFSFLLPFPDEATAVEVFREGVRIGFRAVSANAPELAILSPRARTTVAADGELVVRYEAGDADGGEMAVTVQYRPAATRPWESLAVFVPPGREFRYPASEIPGGDFAEVRVIALDGIHATRAISEPFAVEGKPPFPVIRWPIDGQEAPADNVLVFEGAASDREDRVVRDGSLRWFSDVAGLLGTGPMIDVRGLAVGEHRIRLETEDSDGQTASAEATLFVGVGAPQGGPRFVRGDANQSRTIDIGDAIFTLNHLFLGGPVPPCRDAADSNDDGRIDISDGSYTLAFLFLGGPRPPEPNPVAGEDPTADGLDCIEPAP